MKTKSTPIRLLKNKRLKLPTCFLSTYFHTAYEVSKLTLFSGNLQFLTKSEQTCVKALSKKRNEMFIKFSPTY